MVVLVDILPGHEVRRLLIVRLLDHHMVNETTGRFENFNLSIEMGEQHFFQYIIHFIYFT